ncbi:MAG: polyphosphate polymerase domain-containing protein [bacterium]
MEVARTELKFQITIDEYMQLKNQLRLVMNRDLHADSETGEYTVSSVYFDDLYCSRVGEKADGIEYHQKYRVRSYAGAASRLEFKTKIGVLTAKETLWLTDAMREGLLNADSDILATYLDEPLIADVFIRMKMDDLRPALVVDYRREAFTFTEGDVRITFDKDVEACLFESDRGFCRRILEPHQMILEVKYTGYLPEVLRKIVFFRNFQVVSYSKYYMGWILLNQ